MHHHIPPLQTPLSEPTDAHLGICSHGLPVHIAETEEAGQHWVATETGDKKKQSQVAIDLLLLLKLFTFFNPHSTNKSDRHVSDIFSVDCAWICMPNFSHAFVTVTFTPQKVQNHQCTFKVSLY